MSNYKRLGSVEGAVGKTVEKVYLGESSLEVYFTDGTMLDVTADVRPIPLARDDSAMEPFLSLFRD